MFVRPFVLAAIAGLYLFSTALMPVAGGTGRAEEADFPYDRVLNMDVALMKPSKRKPSLTIAANGTATIDLWCKSIEGKAEVSGEAITITPGELPDAVPAMISYGQCTPERMQADESLRDALAQVSAWRRQGGAIVLSGSATLRFYPSTN